MTRLKVLVIPGWYPTAGDPVSGVFVKETNQAIATCNDVAVLVVEGRDNALRAPFIIEDRQEDFRVLRLRYRQSPIPKTTRLAYNWMLWSAYRKLAKSGFEPDILHAHLYFAGEDALFLGRMFKKPVVVSEHQSRFSRGLVQGKELERARRTFQGAALVCPVSQGLQRDIEQRCQIPARYQVVPNTVNTHIFYANSTPRASSQVRMLFVGALEETHKKGLPILLAALAKVDQQQPEWVLDVVGSGPALSAYQESARQLGIESKIHFHGGGKSKEEVARFMNACDFFVLPSLFETFGIVLLEAMACGKPVIATQVDGPQEIVNDQVGVLVAPNDPQALANAILKMIDDYRQYRPEVLAAYVTSRYSFEAIGNTWDHIYHQALQAPQS